MREREGGREREKERKRNTGRECACDLVCIFILFCVHIYIVLCAVIENLQLPVYLHVTYNLLHVGIYKI